MGKMEMKNTPQDNGPSLTSIGGWQPIETAPKGKKVIVYSHATGSAYAHVMVARYWPRHTLAVAEGYEEEDWVDLGPEGEAFMPADWYEETMGEEHAAVNLKPTHWMPLPSPPEET